MQNISKSCSIKAAGTSFIKKLKKIGRKHDNVHLLYSFDCGFGFKKYFKKHQWNKGLAYIAHLILGQCKINIQWPMLAMVVVYISKGSPKDVPCQILQDFAKLFQGIFHIYVQIRNTIGHCFVRLGRNENTL